MVVIVAPVIAGLLLYGLERAQVELIGQVNRDFAYFFVNFVTFPGTFVHEMAHLCFGVITGAEVTEICMFESGHGQLGHISYCARGPWFIRAVQHALIGVAPTVVGFTLIDHSTMSDSDLEGYFQGVWIFILPLFLLFFGLGYFG